MREKRFLKVEMLLCYVKCLDLCFTRSAHFEHVNVVIVFKLLTEVNSQKIFPLALEKNFRMINLW